MYKRSAAGVGPRPRVLDFRKWKQRKVRSSSLSYIVSLKSAWAVRETPSLSGVVSYPEQKSVKEVYLLTEFLPFLPLSFTQYKVKAD